MPAYHPDTPEVRQRLGPVLRQHHDDGRARPAAACDELEEDGLADDTIVFFYGDHGAGHAAQQALALQLRACTSRIVAPFPEKFRHLAPKDYSPGGNSNRLVGFVDLAPTMLSLAGVQAARTGCRATPSWAATRRRRRTYSFGFRGRMDERYDLVRTVRDQRYVYVRNYMPHKIYGQYIAYMLQTPTTRGLGAHCTRRQAQAAADLTSGKPSRRKNSTTCRTTATRCSNLAASPEHQAILERFRKAHQEHELAMRDVGLLPEAEIHARAKGSTPYEMGHDPKRYPVERVLAAAQLASSLEAGVTAQLAKALEDPDSGVRYWGVIGRAHAGRNGRAGAARRAHEGSGRRCSQRPHRRRRGSWQIWHGRGPRQSAPSAAGPRGLREERQLRRHAGAERHRRPRQEGRAAERPVEDSAGRGPQLPRPRQQGIHHQSPGVFEPNPIDGRGSAMRCLLTEPRP